MSFFTLNSLNPFISQHVADKRVTTCWMIVLLTNFTKLFPTQCFVYQKCPSNQTPRFNVLLCARVCFSSFMGQSIVGYSLIPSFAKLKHTHNQARGIDVGQLWIKHPDRVGHWGQCSQVHPNSKTIEPILYSNGGQSVQGF